MIDDLGYRVVILNALEKLHADLGGYFGLGRTGLVPRLA